MHKYEWGAASAFFDSALVRLCQAPNIFVPNIYMLFTVQLQKMLDRPVRTLYQPIRPRVYGVVYVLLTLQSSDISLVTCAWNFFPKSECSFATRLYLAIKLTRHLATLTTVLSGMAYISIHLEK